MAVIFPRQNRFEGINPIFNGVLLRRAPEDTSTWFAYHFHHVNHISDSLNQYLPDRYVARAIESFQPVEDLIAAVICADDTELSVTRIELLTPVLHEKLKRYRPYPDTPYVELDYFRADSANSYSITVKYPRSPEKTQVYNFAVDSPIPTVDIPLLNDEFLHFDFNEVYQHTYKTGKWGTCVDYAKSLPPEMLASYTPADQERITNRVRSILIEAK